MTVLDLTVGTVLETVPAAAPELFDACNSAVTYRRISARAALGWLVREVRPDFYLTISTELGGGGRSAQVAGANVVRVVEIVDPHDDWVLTVVYAAGHKTRGLLEVAWCPAFEVPLFAKLGVESAAAVVWNWVAYGIVTPGYETEPGLNGPHRAGTRD